MEEKIKISEAEWQVMKVIWDNEPLAANDIIKKLENTEWKPKTIKTLINRLLSKEVLGYEKNGKEYIYYSKISKEECINTENESFLTKVYDGAIKSMLVSFIENYKLSKNDIEDLKNILDNKKD